MRVSILNLNLVAKDAIGTCILNQMRFFLRRGDDVRIYTAYPPKDLAADLVALTTVTTLKDLVGKREDHFRLSDLYIYHYPSSHPLMDSIKTIERGAVIFYYHNVTPPELWRSSVARDELARGVEQVSLVHFADLAVTDSPFNREDLVECGYASERIHVLPLAVPLEQFKPGPKDLALVHRYGLEGQRVLLFVGRMANNKRIDLLVEALPLIKAEVPNVVLLLVGDADSSEPYRDVSEQARCRADELGLAKDVIFTGVVEDLEAYYRLADLYVTASLHEGFGVPLIEAMASGVPMVASRVASHPWVVGEAGLLCEPEDPTDMARQVVQLLQDDKRYGELVQWGLERVRAFSVEAYDVGFAEIVDEAMRWVQCIPPTRFRARRAEAKARGLDSEAYAEGLYPMKPDAVLSRDLYEAIRHLELNYSEVSVDSALTETRPPLIRGPVQRVRGELHGLVLFYVNRLAARQVRINEQTTRALVALVRDLESEVTDLRARLAQLEHKTDRE